MSRIKVIAPAEASGRLKEIYGNIASSRGQVAEVLKIQSLRPESIVKHLDFYMEIMYAKSELRRVDREMMAVVVSVTNKCEYCKTHHAAALNKYWKDDLKINQLAQNDWGFLTEEQRALCHFSKEITLHPHAGNEVDKLRKYAYTDSAILDAALVVSYFNFVNRMVLSLGVELEPDKGENYKY